MAAELSELEKRIRSRALEERRTLADFDRMLTLLGLSEAVSQLNLSLGPWKIGLDHINFFRLDEKRSADQRLKSAFEFCGLDEGDPRHWRALLNALVAECFPKRGRTKTRHVEGLFELLLDIHELQAKNPKLTSAEAIATKLLRSSRFTKKYPSIKKVSSLTKLVRKAQDPQHNPYARYREEQDIALSIMREQHLAAGTDEQTFDNAVRPVLEVAMALGRQRSQEEEMLQHLKRKHIEIKGSACSWEVEQRYRQIVKQALAKRLNEAAAGEG